jgi:hypothetical protein
MPNWKGGRWTSKSDGYVRVYSPDDPRNVNGYLLEHRVVVETSLGRQLTEYEIVHHRNGVRDDNHIDNLVIVSRNNHYGSLVCPRCNYEFVLH